ncbi:MAG TPA: LysM peptidoglycan-binding domain-containing protein [Bacillales bacterium]|nr:LysM peptidoglycan-binding domain-containing protein [Bacillales bacterium]
MKIHIVQKGETLSQIAEKSNVDLESLKKMNAQLTDPDQLMPGMKVKIPTGGVPVKKEKQVKTAGKKEILKKEKETKEKEKTKPAAKVSDEQALKKESPEPVSAGEQPRGAEELRGDDLAVSPFYDLPDEEPPVYGENPYVAPPQEFAGDGSPYPMAQPRYPMPPGPIPQTVPNGYYPPVGYGYDPNPPFRANSWGHSHGPGWSGWNEPPYASAKQPMPNQMALASSQLPEHWPAAGFSQMPGHSYMWAHAHPYWEPNNNGNHYNMIPARPPEYQ